MSAIIGRSIVGIAHAERAVNWAQLSLHYREIAFKLHHMALGEWPKDSNDVGPIYTRQALAMQREGLKLT